MSNLPLIISSLEILTVPHPHVSPQTQGCSRTRQVSQLTKMQTHGSHLLGASAVFPRARVAHKRTELGQGDAPATAAFAASAA